MANQGIKTAPTIVSIPNDLNTFKQRTQLIWSGSNVRFKDTFTPNYGTKTQQKMDSSTSWDAGSTRSIYDSNQINGLRVSATSGKTHDANHEMFGDGRWMPASFFNGLGFEVYQSEQIQHAIYMNFYTIVFVSDTGSYRMWGVNPSDGNNNGPRTGYRYIKFNSSSDLNTIRGWGTSWKFVGLIFHLHTDGGIQSAQSSRIDIYNLKVGHLATHHDGDKYRMIPPYKRPFSSRASFPNNLKLESPFT